MSHQTRLRRSIVDASTLLVIGLTACACGAAAAQVPEPVEAVARPETAPGGPGGREIGRMAPDACLQTLAGSDVEFHAYEGEAAGSVGAAVVLDGPVGGVAIEFEGRNAVHAVLDCRLVLALLAWAPALREAGVVRLRHLSVLRPHARVRSTGRPSGHSVALAIDVRFMDLAEGESLDVLEDWAERARGSEPCSRDHDDDERGATLRRLVCDAAAAQLFQVVITPHHDDDHQNHVHLEVRTEGTWTFLR